MNQYNIVPVEEQYTGFLDFRTDIDSTSDPLPEILFITSYPPRECGIATYSYDLVTALTTQFNQSFTVKICPLESATEKHIYSGDVAYLLNTDDPSAFIRLAKNINDNDAVRIVMIQHEFGFFERHEDDFTALLKTVVKPVITVFHTILPLPDDRLKKRVQEIAALSEAVTVMTNSSAQLLINEYAIEPAKINVIPHGTHLVPHLDKRFLKEKYGFSEKKILSTFGLLSSGKGIETTLRALPAIIKNNPDVLFLIIGKTHPAVLKQEGEVYRNLLKAVVKELALEPCVKFINQFLPLAELLEYLQLTDIYLFTSKDPNQAVSGTFSYAASSGCPIISTPIPHAKEVLQNDAGLTIDFGSEEQLADAVNSLLQDEIRLKNMGSKGLHTMAATAWENAAIAHAILFAELGAEPIALHYTLPAINLDHIRRLTTGFGMIQFSKINHPDISSGYTLDDNARALVAMCQLYKLDPTEETLHYIQLYFRFIKFCHQHEGDFLNYVDEEQKFTSQNASTNLEDSNGRAIWALGFLVSMHEELPDQLVADAQLLMQIAVTTIHKIHSTRAMAFVIKGLYYRHTKNQFVEDSRLIKELADRLVQMYRHEADKEWMWYESYLTYGNSSLPEALLCAWMATGEEQYKTIAQSSFDFLLSKTFAGNRIRVISNKTWHYKLKQEASIAVGGEQPIDVAYTIMALSKFYDVFEKEEYGQKLITAFNWFLGNNHLHQIMYNPCTGGCYDGLEEYNVNLNQGAESTVSYLMARLTVEKHLETKKEIHAGSNHVEADVPVDVY